MARFRRVHGIAVVLPGQEPHAEAGTGTDDEPGRLRHRAPYLQGFELVGGEPCNAQARSRKIIYQAHFRQSQLGGKRIPGDLPVQISQRYAVRRDRSRHR
jgi:hypothetical protein